MESGTTITKLEELVAALSLKPSHVAKPHIQPNAGGSNAAADGIPAATNPEGEYGDN